MSFDFQHRFGTGIEPKEFIQGMTQNKEKFLDWYEKFSLENQEDAAFFGSLKDKHQWHCFILAADWCGDVVRNVPVVFKVLESAGIPTEVLIMEQNTDVMEQFLTMGGRSIPIVIFTDLNGKVLGKWGPRPNVVQEVMIQFKGANPDRNALEYEENLRLTYSEMMKRYNSGSGTDYQQWIVDELRELLATF
ncbi:thioredoxin family protein [Ammoniphilus resinae]|uniref:Thioredoxin family protein n=1 Tax=Ammoniphilus resinae TaxID=861532 RepID=A0ABS4GMW1_9BACL|nr:thioredoxin family protein [Ammoniphilus resinae]MBP1931620.1 hypothetical protein [Ammoniphilus resinae]